MLATQTCHVNRLQRVQRGPASRRSACVASAHRQSEQAPVGRRAALGLAVPFLFLGSKQASAEEITNDEVERLRKSDYVKKLLEQSAAKKEERVKERLDDYNRRNFGDYFDYVQGSIDRKSATENDKEILEWIEKNSKK